MKIEDVARIAYDAVRSYAAGIGDNHHRRWGKLTEEHRQSLIDGALFHFVNPQIGPEAAHLMRCKKLMDKGWAFGLDKDEGKKLTPILVEWDHLPEDRKMKYFIFCVVAGNLAQYVEDGPEPPQMAAVTDPLSEAVGADTTLISAGSEPQEPSDCLPSDTEPTPSTDDRQVGVGGAVPDEPVTPEEIDESEKDAKRPDAA